MSLLSKNKLKYIQSLKEKKNREVYRTFVAEGDKMVTDLLPLLNCEILLATPDFISANVRYDFNIQEVLEVAKSDIERASFLKTPQQVLAVFFMPEYNLESVDPSDQLIIALDGVQDPGNLGTIIRLADWYGIDSIVCSTDTVDVYNPKVVQATMGALSRVKIYYTDLPTWIGEQEDTPVYGTFLDGDDIYQTEISGKGIIIMGNEGRGIRSQTERLVTQKLYIPNYPKERDTSESLNVAIATAIVCSEFRRRLF